MENNGLDMIIKGLPQFCGFILPVAKRSGITGEEALCMLIRSEYPDYYSFYSALLDSSVKSLRCKGCIKEDGISLTSKGEIIARSVVSAKERFSMP